MSIDIKTKLRLLIDFCKNLSTPIFILGCDGNILFGSHKCNEIIGSLPDTASESKLSSLLLNPSDQRDFERLLLKLKNNPSDRSCTEVFFAQITLKAKITKWYEFKISTILIIDEYYYKVECICINEHPTFYSDELDFYKTIVEKIPLDVAICSPEKKYAYVNPSAVKNPELRKFIIGKTDFEYFSHLGRSLEIPRIRSEKFDLAIKIKDLVAWYDEIKDKNGESRHILRNWYPVFNSDSRLKFMIGFGLDITDKELLRKGLASQIQISKKYKKAVEEGTIVSLTDKKGNFLFVNNGFCSTTGYKKTDLLGKHFNILNIAQSNDTSFTEMEPIIKGGGIWKGALQLRAKDGDFLWVLLTVIPILDKGGKPEEYFQICIDITRQKKYEHEILNNNTQLEKRVEERTKEIAAINEDLASFNYMVSHDLQAPLRRLSSFSQILLKNNANTMSPETNELLKIIDHEAKQMSAMCHGLLNLAKLGKGDIALNRLEMNEVVNSCIAALTKENLQNIEITITEMGSAYADGILLRQVWQNLINNAIKYSSKAAHPKIEIGRVFKNDICIYFIRDNGCGFDSKHKERLFGVFQRLHSQHEFEGTGIGLATVKRIIERHGGDIWAESEINRGATFYFTLYKYNNI